MLVQNSHLTHGKTHKEKSWPHIKITIMIRARQRLHAPRVGTLIDLLKLADPQQLQEFRWCGG